MGYTEDELSLEGHWIWREAFCWGKGVDVEFSGLMAEVYVCSFSQDLGLRRSFGIEVWMLSLRELVGGRFTYFYISLTIEETR